MMKELSKFVKLAYLPFLFHLYLGQFDLESWKKELLSNQFINSLKVYLVSTF